MNESGGGRKHWFVRLLLPSELRDAYSRDIGELLDERLAEARAGGGTLSVLACRARFLIDLVGTAARSWHRALLGRFASRGLRIPELRRSRGFVDDVRYALRVARRTPGLTTIAVVILGLGLGATTLAYSIADAVLLEPLAYADSDRLVTVFTVWDNHPDLAPDEGDSMSPPDVVDVQEGSPSITSLVGYARASATLTDAGDAVAVDGARVSEGLLATFEVAPAIGRDIRRDESGVGAARVAVIGYALWRDRFAMSPDVVGRGIDIGGGRYEIVGVAPEGFDFPSGAQLWVPYAFRSADSCGRACHTWWTVGRLADGAALSSARNELAAIGSSLASAYPESNAGKSFMITSLRDEMVRPVRARLWVLFGATTMVLLIACTNVANLLLVRSLRRTGEVAVRAALGAGRARLARQVVLESALIAVMGGALGSILALVGVDSLRVAAAGEIPRVGGIAVDGTVLLFELGLVAVTAVLIGLSPFIYLTRASLTESLAHAGRSGDTSRIGPAFRRFLTGAEVALSVVLLFGAGLLLRTFAQLNSVELGFRVENVVRFSLSKAGPLEDVSEFYRALEERISMLPGVESVGSIQGAPLGPWHTTSEVEIVGEPPRQPGEETYAGMRPVTPHYLETMGIPLVRGRTLTPADDAGSLPVAVVNETFVRQNFPDRDPLGHRVRVLTDHGYGSPEWTIVGVVADIRSESLSREPIAEIYATHGHFGPGWMTVAVRGAELGSLIPAVRREVRSLDPRIPLRYVETVEDAVDREIAPTRLVMQVASLLAAVALTLAAVGLHGVLAYLVSRRTHEIGVRLALGARAGGIVSLVAWEVLRIMALGTLVGLALSLWVARALASLLYDVAPQDPWTIGLVLVVLIVVGLAASLIPVRTACGVDPVRALRAE